MRKTLISASALVFALSGAAFAQSATGTMNNAGGMKSNAEKAMDGSAARGDGMQRGDMPATTGTAPGAATAMPANRDGGEARTVPGNAGANPVR